MKPRPKQRPRFSGKAVYTPKETIHAESVVKTSVKIEMLKNRIKISTKHIKLKLIFYYLRTKTSINTDSYEFRSKKPDVDNLAKLIMDALNGVLYKDDGQVSILHCEKRYSDVEGIHLSAEEIDCVD